MVAFCLLGLLRFRLETDPLTLWVGTGSLVGVGGWRVGVGCVERGHWMVVCK